MEILKTIEEHVGVSDKKFFKTTLFQSERLLLGLNCLAPGQIQSVHEHSDQDKFYFVIEGTGHFTIGDKEFEASAGQIIWAPCGVNHGVRNPSKSTLTLLVGIGPSP